MRSREKCAVDGHVFASEQADRDLGFVAVERAPVEAAALVGDAHDGARLGLRRAHVAAVHPQMAGAQPFDAARADDYGGFCHDSRLLKNEPAMVRYNDSGVHARPPASMRSPRSSGATASQTLYLTQSQRASCASASCAKER